MVINHNISALNTYNQLSKNENATSKSLQKLSSGLRINSAADDAAGLAISQKMTAQVNGLDQANSNAQNGVSLVQTAEGALNETQSILQRMRELAVQSSNDTNQSEDRGDIQAEVNQLAQEITDISNDTEFNSQKLLNGGIDGTNGSLTFQVGANEGQTLNVKVGAMDAKTLGVTSDAFQASAAGGSDDDTVLSGATVSLSGTTIGSAVRNGEIDMDFSTSGKIVMSDKYGNSQTLTAGTDYTAANASFTVSSGAFEGLKVDLGTGNKISDLKDAGDKISVSGMSSSAIFYNGNTTAATATAGIDVSTQSAASSAISTIDTAISTVSTQRANLGAYQNRLEHTMNNLTTESQNLTSASSAITDVDMAKEMMNYSKYNILNQAAEAMLSQANQLPSGILSLLK